MCVCVCVCVCVRVRVYVRVRVCVCIQLKSKVYTHLAESAKCLLFYQLRGIVQNACYCLFITDLNIFHIKDVYM